MSRQPKSTCKAAVAAAQERFTVLMPTFMSPTRDVPPCLTSTLKPGTINISRAVVKAPWPCRFGARDWIVPEEVVNSWVIDAKKFGEILAILLDKLLNDSYNTRASNHTLPYLPNLHSAGDLWQAIHRQVLNGSVVWTRENVCC